MGRKVAMLWHALFSIGAGVLFFYFVLPRWPELVGDISHKWGTTLRIVTGALIGLAALPVVFTLLRTRKPELGTPQLALSIRTWSIVAHVLSGVLIIGTAISEIWLNLDNAGQWLFAIYGAAAAIAVLGFFAFYLSFVAELPPPPPKPIKPKKEKKPRLRGRKRGAAASEDVDEDEENEEDEEDAEEEADETDESDATEAADVPAKVSLDKDESPEPEPVTEEVKVEKPEEPDEPKEPAAEADEATTETTETSDETTETAAQPRLRNRRPTGKTSHRRRRTRGGVAVEE